MQFVLKKSNKARIALLPILFILLHLIIISCSNVEGSRVVKKNNLGDDDFIIWAHSDIQPRDVDEYEYYETAIEDINKNVPNVNMALVAGDIIHWSNSPHVFQWYVSMKKKSYIKYWYEIAGNHDQKDYESYKKVLKMPLHYSVQAGNILILLMSDENKDAETVISDTAFRWWRRMVISNQDKIIITVSHGYLKHSGLFGAFINSRNINDSDRFAEVLRKYRVDIWLCGHMHIPQWVNTRVKIKENLNGTIFMNIAWIRGNLVKDPESNILFFKKDSDVVLIKSRDHADQEYNDWLDIRFKLSHKFQWDGSNPVMKALKYEKASDMKLPFDSD